MPSTRTLKHLVASSGLAFASFVVLHYISHYSLTLSGWSVANRSLKRFRVIYQNPLFELMMLLSVAVHVYANLVLKLKRDKIAGSAKDKKNDGYNDDDIRTTGPGSQEYLGHRMAGYIVGILIISHVVATRVVPAFVLKDPSVYDYSFFTNTNDTLPYSLFVAIQVLFAMAGGWHTIYGTWSAIHTLRGHSVAGKEVPPILKVFAVSNHLLIISAALAITGVYYTVDKASKMEDFEKVHKVMSFK